MSATWRKIYKGREYVCWKESGRQRQQLAHRWLWERDNGPIPPGLHIHHRDHNALNNVPENLQLLTAEQHRDHHGRDREDHVIIDGLEHRRCQRCDAMLPLSEFAARRAGTYQGYCRDCQREYLREWRRDNRDRANAYQRKWYAAHRESV